MSLLAQITTQDQCFHSILWISLYTRKWTSEYEQVVSNWDGYAPHEKHEFLIGFTRASEYSTTHMSEHELSSIPVAHVHDILKHLESYPAHVNKWISHFEHSRPTFWPDRVQEIKQYFKTKHNMFL